VVAALRCNKAIAYAFEDAWTMAHEAPVPDSEVRAFAAPTGVSGCGAAACSRWHEPN
jgi:hypothetical protein